MPTNLRKNQSSPKTRVFICQNIRLFPFPEPSDGYREEMMKTLRVISEAEVTGEVNTRWIYKQKVSETYPSRWVLEQMLALNIPVVLNSDARHPREITLYFAESARMRREIGYRQLCVLLAEKWQEVDFNENGLLL